VILVSKDVWESATRAITKNAMSSWAVALPPPEACAAKRKRLSTMVSLIAALMLTVHVEENPDVHFSSVSNR
jgi:hypothetical protein